MGEVCPFHSKSARTEADMTEDRSKLLPPEILELISNLLPLKDFIAFRSVCRRWRLAPSGRSEISSFSKEKPWFMIYGLKEEKCYLYSDSHPNPCAFYFPDLRGVTVMASKFGWLVAHSSEHFFLYNCFTLRKINLPNHIITSDQACTFTTLPTRSDCIVFVVTRKCNSNLELSTCRVGGKKWEVEIVSISKDCVDSMQSVQCCSCSVDYSHCSCFLQNKIVIFGAEKCSIYDYSKKEVTYNGMKGKPLKSVVDYYQVVSSRHCTDWLQRFGSEKGVRISICASSVRAGNVVGTGKTQQIFAVKGNGEFAADQLNIVNAVWIDPKYEKELLIRLFGKDCYMWSISPCFFLF